MGLPDLVGDHLQLLLYADEAGRRVRVRLTFDGLVLDLELEFAAPEVVDLLRQAVQLHPDAAGGLVDEVDGGVGEAAVRHVAVRHGGGGDDGQVGDADAVVDLVLLFDAAQDGDGLLHARFVDEDGLEAPL